MDRRNFIYLSGLLPFFGLKNLIGCVSNDSIKPNFNQKLAKDPRKIVDINSHLKYRIISKEGAIMSDGFKVPGLADGMGSFSVNDKIVLVRNHEIVPSHGIEKGPFQNPKAQIKHLGDKHYDKNAVGGTTNVLLDKKSKGVLKEYLSLSGTHQNCAGGTTPWGTWLTCEEKVSLNREDKISHGYVFEVDPRNQSINDPIPLKKMGRFNHEAVAFDSLNNAYLTEDRSDGLIYKFEPKTPNSLENGELFALKINDIGDARNWGDQKAILNKPYPASWIKVEDYDPKQDTLREEGMMKGATPFARPEGIIADDAGIYICCTSGGSLKKGQIWKITPTLSNELSVELWYEVQDDRSLNMPDNITISPWGDLIVCEDNSDINRLWGINQKGEPYLIAQNSYSGSEFAGACFSPFDNTMFVNLQSNGLTLMIDGNWGKVRA
tara:strand:+ start:1288 stop:2595 length:1308 start_codon:yes stop_codon:yes gene_type:complete